MASYGRIIDIDPVDDGGAGTGVATGWGAGAPAGFRRPSNGHRARERVEASNVEAGAPRPSEKSSMEPIEFRAPSYGRATAASAAGERDEATGVAGVLGGAAQTVAGAAVMAAGVPMLVLPGPGLLTIGAGAALASGGIKKMTGKGKGKASGSAD